ncbi:MAG: hypothetical protein EOO45_14680 [Flavobacterium sp.]|nr:MAG: hypothetical protein EOO45_14680 [Flavobacterium sp.]
MKKITLFVALFLISVAYSQDKVSGYYINMAGQRTDGFFKDAYFEDETTLRFSTSTDGKFDKLETANVKEYGIGNDYKFVKETIQMDMSGSDGSQLGLNKEPNFETKTVFLNVLTEGDASLYSRYVNGVNKLFYKIDSKQITIRQLVYKKYRVANFATAENNQYRQQLYADLMCGKTYEINKYVNVSYNKKDIIPLIKAYNDCKGHTSVIYENSTAKKAKMYYSVYAGLFNSKMSITGLDYSLDNGGSDLGFTGGIEVSYVFPSEVFGIFVRGEYETISFNQDVTPQNPWGNTTTTYSYNVESGNLNFILGPRYYIPIADRSKIYIDAGMLVSFTLNGELSQDIDVNYESGESVSVSALKIPLTNAVAFSFGAGYVLNNKFAAEVRLDTNRDYLGETNLNIKVNHSRLGLFLKYTIN